MNKKLGVVDLPDGRRRRLLYVCSDHPVILVEAGPEFIDLIIEGNGLKEISRMTVGREDLVSHLGESRNAVD